MSITRLALLDATRAVLLDVGYAQLTTRKVAARAQVRLSLIHYHFVSKEAMLLEMFAEESARLLDRQAAIYTRDEPLSVQWERECDHLDEDIRSGYVRILHELTAAGYHAPAIAAQVRRVLDSRVDRFERAFTHHAARGIDIGIAPATIGALACAAFLGIGSSTLVGLDTGDLPAREALRSVSELIDAAEWRASATSPPRPDGRSLGQ